MIKPGLKISWAEDQQRVGMPVKGQKVGIATHQHGDVRR
jgi:hypothetical protein